MPELAFSHFFFLVDIFMLYIYVQDVRDDVLGAQNAGLKGALVKTGKYVEGDETKYGKPDFCFSDFPAVVDAICSWLK
jgi:ribonucleotide monophosphatase NagD (HAD superfamily)